MTAYTKTTILFLILLISLSSTLGYSKDIKKQYYFMGGGGEPKGDSTIFDGDLELVANFVTKSDWDTTISFDGGHKKTEELIKNKMSKAHNAGSFVEKSYNDLVDEMINKIKSGELSRGDQLMVNINTHGARKTSREKTHQIALAYGEATDLKNLKGARVVSLDKLEELADLAANAGVKLAIVDVSCFSGNTLNIKNDKTCMISASGPEHYGFAGQPINTFFGNYTYTFGTEFFDSFKKGRNLEDIYLRARTVGIAPDFPMINTNEGKAIHEMIYKFITPYLNFNEKTSTDFSDNYSDNKQKFEERSCSFKNNYEQFQNLLAQMNSLNSTVDEYNNLRSSEFTQLKSALEKYRDYQLKYEQSLRAKLDSEKEILEILNRDFPGDKKLWESYSPMDLLSLDSSGNYDYWAGVLKEETTKNPNGNVKWLKDMVDNIKKKMEFAQQVKEKLSPETKKKISDHADLFAKSGLTRGLAENVSAAAKKVYNILYKNMKNNKSNPCRDFVL